MTVSSAARPAWTRVFITIGWTLLLVVPFIGFWALLRPYWNSGPSSRAKWFSALTVAAALIFIALRGLNEPMVLPGVPLFDALAGATGFLGWFAWLSLTWSTTEG